MGSNTQRVIDLEENGHSCNRLKMPVIVFYKYEDLFIVINQTWPLWTVGSNTQRLIDLEVKDHTCNRLYTPVCWPMQKIYNPSFVLKYPHDLYCSYILAFPSIDTANDVYWSQVTERLIEFFLSINRFQMSNVYI